MKKIFLFILVCFSVLLSIYYVVANYEVIVSATVNSPNHAPLILSVNPSDDPRLLRTNRIQHYTMYFKDDETDSTVYSIMSGSGYIYPANGSILSTSFDSNSGAFINFTYSAPPTIPASHTTKITVVINDGTNVVTKDINIYIY